MPRHASRRAGARTSARCVSLLIASVCVGLPSAARSQWPQETAAGMHRAPPKFRATWTSGDRTIEQLAVSENPDEPFQLRGRSLLSPGNSLRWLRSLRLISKGTARSGVEFFGDDFLPGKLTGLTIHAG